MNGSTIPEAVLRTLHSAKRNRYFYGKPLDVAAFQLEQCYGIDLRWLDNRSTLGPGVVCGLQLVPGQDGRLALQPGLAVDGVGREIVVPAPVPVDPFQPTDSLGRQAGERLAAGAQTTIRLCYTECAADPTAVGVSDCDGGMSAQAGSTVERYLITVTAGLPATRPPMLTPEQRTAIFPGEPADGFDRLVAAMTALQVSCQPPDQSCVVVATVTLGDDATPTATDQYGYRAEVFSNTVLFQLIAALADRVDACCAALHPPEPDTLMVVSGDGQTAPTDEPLGEPVVLRVDDSAGDPVDGDAVQVTVAEGTVADADDAGVPAAASLTVTSHDGGAVRLSWTLGATVGQQTLSARLVATDQNVTVSATGSEAPEPPPPPPPPPPPRVNATRPGNGDAVSDNWRGEPTLTIAFDQQMSEASLQDPDRWLGLWWFVDFGGGDFSPLRRIRLGLIDLGGGTTPTYRGEPVPADRFVVLLVMLGSAPEIVAEATGEALDSEFAGTRLTADQIGQLWGTEEFQADREFIDAVVNGGGVLPSGDGQPGGDFFSAYFRLDADN